jgi:hypothetical protein
MFNRERSAVVRRYQDGDGVRWQVRELRNTAARLPALYFESDSAFRRVTRYPADWRDLPTGELEILSHGT